jgi:hypothetical protein
MERFKVRCKIDGDVWEQIIECREMTIDHNSYCFWTGDYGATNRLIWAFPAMFTVVEGLEDINPE